MEKINERVKEIRELVKHENDLINNRLTWMVLFETFLLGGYVILLSNIKNFAENTFILKITLSIIGLVGLFTTLSIFLSLRKADVSIHNLLDKYCSYFHKYLGKDIDNEKKYITSFPIVFGYISDINDYCSNKESKISRYLLPWYVLPAIFVLAWLLLSMIPCFALEIK